MGQGLIVEESTYDIRYSTLEDFLPLKEWMLNEEVRKWYPPSSEKDVDLFTRNWIGFARFRASLTATYQGKPVGIATIFLMPYLKVAHLCMMYLIVDPNFARQGIGKSLIRNIKHHAKKRFKLESMHVEVFEGSPVIPLLEELGFEEIIRQENFVKLGEEFFARIVYETPL